MEVFVGLALFFILFSVGAGIIAMGMAFGYLIIVTGIFPWWVIIPVIAGWIWWLGGQTDPE